MTWEEHAVAASIVEALFVRALGPRLDAGCRQRLRKAGIDLDRPLLPFYPIAAWRRATEIVTASLYGAAVEAGHTELGRLLVIAYAQSPNGSNLAPALKQISPVRALELAVKHLRLGNDETLQPVLTQLGATHFEVRFENLGPHPHVMRSALETALRFSRMQNPIVTLVDGDNAALQVRWDGPLD